MMSRFMPRLVPFDRTSWAFAFGVGRSDGYWFMTLGPFLLTWDRP